MKLEQHFEERVANSRDFREALSLVRKSSGPGHIWVIGGLVYRSIVGGLYDREAGLRLCDFDFIVENPLEFDEIPNPPEWKVIKTGLGEPRFIRGNQQIDVVSLDGSINPWEDTSLVEMSRDEKLKSYFRRVPLNVQAIAYDVNEQKIVGDRGVEAIEEKRIVVNNLDECLAFCERRKISVRSFIKKKSESLGFQAVIPDFADENKMSTKKFYNTYSAEYERERGRQSFVVKNLGEELSVFLKKLPGPEVLDLGAGPGRDALIFKEKGLSPVCIDSSSAMVKLCREKGLKAIKMDMESLDFDDSTFDGVWAFASLVHIPKKRIHNTIARLREILKPGGVFFVSVLEGEGEVFYESKKWPGKIRFFALYRDDEFRNILSEYFEIIGFKRLSTPRGEVSLNYLARNNSS